MFRKSWILRFTQDDRKPWKHFTEKTFPKISHTIEQDRRYFMSTIRNILRKWFPLVKIMNLSQHFRYYPDFGQWVLRNMISKSLQHGSGKIGYIMVSSGGLRYVIQWNQNDGLDFLDGLLGGIFIHLVRHFHFLIGLTTGWSGHRRLVLTVGTSSRISRMERFASNTMFLSSNFSKSIKMRK